MLGWGAIFAAALPKQGRKHRTLLPDTSCRSLAPTLRKQMSRLAWKYELRKELKADADNAEEQMYFIRTVICSYQAISPVITCAAMKGLVASSKLLFNTCIAANAGVA
jgi:ferritin-like metal-binding protein YciE